MNNQSSKTKLFLIELIIIILFFSIAGAICVNIFASARLMSTKSTDITMANMVGQTAVEAFRNSESALDGVLEEYGTIEVPGGYLGYFDGNWKAAPEENDQKYEMNIKLSEDDEGLATFDVEIKKEEDVLYGVTAKKYLGK